MSVSDPSADVYRSCASVVLLRRNAQHSADGFEILLLKKPRKRDAWQLPQGGCEEGETIEQAALRELQEEAGIRARVIGKSDHVYQYEFPASYRRFRPDHVCGQRIAFIYAVQEGTEPITVDAVEISAFAWATPDRIHLYIRRKRYLDLVRVLFAEAAALLDAGADVSAHAA